jgi:putative transposase
MSCTPLLNKTRLGTVARQGKRRDAERLAASPISNASNRELPETELPSLVLTYKYRLLPTRKQHKALVGILESQRQLYNGALEHRIGAWQKAAKTVTLYSQMAELVELRSEPEFSVLPSNLQRWTLRRLDEAYQGFFRRVKAKGEKAGFPRFRGKGRWSSFGFAEFSGIRLIGKRLYFKGIGGGLRMHLHRPLPDARPLCCTFTRDHKGWSVCLQYRVPVAALPKTGKQTGIDFGLTHLATLSTGEQIPNPRVAKRAESELRRHQRALARCKKGSNRRKKAKQQLARSHARVKSGRRTYLHQVSAKLVRETDVIVIEDLNVKGLAGSMLAKAVHDASWAALRQMLAYKAEKAGREVVVVDPKYTSQTCPDCGIIAKKKLSERTHRCDCGCVLDRDHAAAKVILQRGRSGSRSSQREVFACA